MQESQKIYTIEELRDAFVDKISERQNVSEGKYLLDGFDQIFKETIFSEKALTVQQIEAIVKDSKNKLSSQTMKATYQTLDSVLEKLHKHKKQLKKQEQQQQKQIQDNDSFHFDSEQREKQSSEDDVDDDYINDLKKT